MTLTIRNTWERVADIRDSISRVQFETAKITLVAKHLGTYVNTVFNGSLDASSMLINSKLNTSFRADRVTTIVEDTMNDNKFVTSAVDAGVKYVNTQGSVFTVLAVQILLYLAVALVFPTFALIWFELNIVTMFSMLVITYFDVGRIVKLVSEMNAWYKG